MLTSQRVKNPKAKKGCILCFNIGAAAPPYAYIEVEFIPISLNPLPVVKEVGLCFKHCRAKTDNNPNGILDPEIGLWLNPFTRQEKVGGGGMPIREELYQLSGGRKNTKIVTGPAGKIPVWF